ncbi:hypothetical protein [Paraclostridium bifermentans]|uniref:hypothetical protein n=1 Tax=Paraclostridium bifermentans TaxID=1490 RepID=UPI00359C9240
MAKKCKSECNNQWAGGINSLTSKTGVKEKDATNNQWTSTLKKSPEVYSENCHPEKHSK